MPTIKFSVRYNGEIIKVEYDSSIKLLNFILDFEAKHTNYISLHPLMNNLIVKGKLIDYVKFRNEKLGNLIKENQIVVFIRCEHLNCGGGPELLTVDLSKNKIKEITQSKKVLWYNCRIDGLNILSICKNKKCTAYNDDISIKIGFIQDWYLIDKVDKVVKCPCCGNNVEPDNYSFKNCFFQINYIMKVENDYESGTIKSKTGFNSEVEFDKKIIGIANFVKITFTTTNFK